MKHLLTLSLLLVYLYASGQELAPALISAAGDSYTNGEVQLSWSLGGSVLDSYEHNDIVLSSGIQSEEVNPYVLGFHDSPVTIQAFPNPVRDRLTLQFDIRDRYQWIISDLTGRAVLAGQTSHSKSNTVDVSHLGIGAYLLQVYTEGLRPIKKFKLSKIR